MTERLYYDNAYLKSFEALVTTCKEAEGGGYLVILDRSAFYPTSGGQPFDTGCIGAAKVTDVEADERGEVVHRTDAPLKPGETVHCEIDWPRRFDHMQQHGGEHILAGSLQALLGGFTHGLHIGAEVCTIDVTMPDGRTHLTEEELQSLGELANRRVQQAAPIRCWFPSSDEMARLPLRKEPTVTEHIRVVMAGDFECVACGGTHPKNTGEIGLIIPLGAAPARGKLRLSFLCGMRALKYMQQVQHSAGRAGAALSAPPEELGQAAEQLKSEQAALRAQLSALKKENASLRAKTLKETAQPLSAKVRLVSAELPDANLLQGVAAELIAEDGILALLSAPGEDSGSRLLFARSANLPHDMGALLRACGARGGGRPDFAQGVSKEPEALTRAEKLVQEENGHES